MMDAVPKRFEVVIRYKVDCRESGRTVSTEVLGDEMLREDGYSNIWTAYSSRKSRETLNKGPYLPHT